MSILRPACYKLFAPIIEAVYESFERGSGQPKLDINDKPELEQFIIQTIDNTLKEKKSRITPSTDLFAYGVDSLQATRIRNVLVQRLEFGEGRTLGQNIVYEHPSVEKLADYLLEVKGGAAGGKTVDQQHAAMVNKVEKWYAALEKPKMQDGANGHRDQDQVVVSKASLHDLESRLMLCSDPDWCDWIARSSYSQ